MFLGKLTKCTLGPQTPTSSKDISPQFFTALIFLPLQTLIAGLPLHVHPFLLAGCHGQDKPEPYSAKNPSGLGAARPCDSRSGWSHHRLGRTLQMSYPLPVMG